MKAFPLAVLAFGIASTAWLVATGYRWAGAATGFWCLVQAWTIWRRRC